MEAERPQGGPWDWIFSSSMLQWASDPAEVFSAWRSCLAPSGRVLGGVFAAGSLAEWNKLAGDTSPIVWRAPQEWRAHLAESDFQLLRDQCVKRVFRYRSALSLLRSLHDVGGAPHRRYAAGRLRRHIRDYDAKFRCPDGVTASWTFYRFEAKKGSGCHYSIPAAAAAGIE